MAEASASSPSKLSLGLDVLGGSWVVISRVISRVARVITYIRRLITPLITTHAGCRVPLKDL